MVFGAFCRKFRRYTNIWLRKFEFDRRLGYYGAFTLRGFLLHWIFGYGRPRKPNSIPLRAGRAGDLNASIGFDSLMGVLGGPGASIGGWDTSFARSGAQKQTLSLAQADPPASLSAAVAPAGSIEAGTAKITSITNWEGSVEQVYCAAGCPVLVGEPVAISGSSNRNFNRTVTVRSMQTGQFWSFNSETPGDGTGGEIPKSYFYFVEANLEGLGCPASSSTGPSQEVAVAPTSGKQAIKLSCKTSSGIVIAGYRAWRGSSPGAENAYVYVQGPNSSSFVDAGQGLDPRCPQSREQHFSGISPVCFRIARARIYEQQYGGPCHSD